MKCTVAHTVEWEKFHPLTTMILAFVWWGRHEQTKSKTLCDSRWVLGQYHYHATDRQLTLPAGLLLWLQAYEESMNKIEGNMPRVGHGGSWNSHARYCCSAFRANTRLVIKYSAFGLRLVRKVWESSIPEASVMVTSCPDGPTSSLLRGSDSTKAMPVAWLAFAWWGQYDKVKRKHIPQWVMAQPCEGLLFDRPGHL